MHVSLIHELRTYAPTVQTASEHDEWVGYKLVCDNVDRNIRPRHQTSTRQTKSVHMVQVMAVLGRINLSHLSDIAPQRPRFLSMNDFIPQKVDLQE
jgi:hypothetical protein